MSTDNTTATGAPAGDVDTTTSANVDTTVENVDTTTVSEPDTVETLKAKLEKAADDYKALLKHSRNHEDRVRAFDKEKKEWETTKNMLETKLTKFSTELDEKTNVIKKITVDGLKTKTAAEFGIPVEAAFRFFRAETEDELKVEAAEFKKFTTGDTGGTPTTTKPPVVPINRTQASGAGAGTNSKDPREALKEWQAKNLKK